MSYSVFFVEDEATIREQIRESMDWSSTDFDYLGDAADGETALMRISELQPDIVVTDIRMPHMDGLELSRGIQYESPDTCVLILSGYSDFEYAREAVSLNVAEYLLKPITPAKLMKALRTAAERVDKRRSGRHEMDTIRQELLVSRELQCERYFQNLMTGLDVVSALQRADALGIELRAGAYAVVAVHSRMHLNMTEFQLLISQTGTDAYGFRIGYREAGILVKADSLERIEHDLARFCQQLNSSLEFAANSIHMEAGMPVERLSNVKDSFQNACMKLELHENMDTMDREELWRELNALKSMEGLNTQSLFDFLKTGSLNDVESFVDGYLGNDGENHMGLVYTLYTLSHLLFVIREYMEHNKFTPNMIPEIDRADIYDGTTDVRSECRTILRAVLAARDVQKDNHYQDMIDAICQKIRIDYADGDISLNTLAQFSNTSPAYLSTIFKRCMGQTLSSYITDVRLSRAKELLRTTGMRTAEVAEAVGYSDPNYFSMFFKKHTGMTTREYRNEK